MFCTSLADAALPIVLSKTLYHRAAMELLLSQLLSSSNGVKLLGLIAVSLCFTVMWCGVTQLLAKPIQCSQTLGRLICKPVCCIYKSCLLLEFIKRQVLLVCRLQRAAKVCWQREGQGKGKGERKGEGNRKGNGGSKERVKP